MGVSIFGDINGAGRRLARRRFIAFAQDHGVPEIAANKDALRSALDQMSAALGYRVSFRQIYGAGYSGGRVTAEQFVAFCQFAARSGVYIDYRDLILFVDERRIDRRSLWLRYLPESETVAP